MFFTWCLCIDSAISDNHTDSAELLAVKLVYLIITYLLIIKTCCDLNSVWFSMWNTNKKLSYYPCLSFSTTREIVKRSRILRVRLKSPFPLFSCSILRVAEDKNICALVFQPYYPQRWYEFLQLEPILGLRTWHSGLTGICTRAKNTDLKRTPRCSTLWRFKSPHRRLKTVSDLEFHKSVVYVT